MMWKLPVVFIIENNNYAMGTSVKRTTNVEDMSEIGKSYHMPSKVVDGMSVESVHLANLSYVPFVVCPMAVFVCES